MLIFPPPLENLERDGFTKNDILGRKWIGENLASLVTRAEDALVIALDAPWGEGKTTFLRQWRGYLKNELQMESIYLDAFANDYRNDPFSILAEEIESVMEEIIKSGGDKKLRDKMLRKMRTVKQWVLKSYGNAIRMGGGIASTALNSSIPGDPSIQAASKGVELTAKYIAKKGEEYLESRSNYKKSMEGVRNSLRELGSIIKEFSGKPLIFIIDELDRCRPDFALDLLENIKHIFSVPGITFLLSYNGKQMNAYIKCRYGNDVEPDIYLRKFIDVSVSFPAETENRPLSRLKGKFINSLRERMGIPIRLEFLAHYATENDIDLRSIEKIITRIALFISSTTSRQCEDGDAIEAFCILSVCNSGLLENVEKRRECWNDINIFFKFDRLVGMEDSWTRFRDFWRLIANDRNNSEKTNILYQYTNSINITIYSYTNALRLFTAR